jgi:predicted transcriptional regulator
MDTISKLSRDILFSVHPKYAAKILDGQKTVELRRKFPEGGTRGALAFIYSSSPVSAVVGYTRIKYVVKLPIRQIWKLYGGAACISKNDFNAYFAGLRFGFAILFDGVKTLERQIKASDLRTQFGIVPPQSYRYVSANIVALLNDERFQASDRYQCGDRPRRRSTRSSVSR